MPHESTGHGSRGFAVFANGLTGDQGHLVPVDSLDKAFSARREIEEHLGWSQLHRRPTSEIDVCAFSGLEDTAVFEADQAGGIRGLSLDEPFQFELFAAGSVTSIVQHEE